MIQKINLTKGSLGLLTIDYGTWNFEVKCGRKTYMVDVKKDSCCVVIDVYNKVKKDRTKYSKYDSDADNHFITLSSEKYPILDRELLENIAEYQEIVDKFKNINNKYGIF